MNKKTLAISILLSSLSVSPAFAYIHHHPHHRIVHHRVVHVRKTKVITVAHKNADKTVTTTKEVSTSTTYKQWGKFYSVMKTSKNYDETGMASWYGKDFQHHYTSSGERYNMYSMTAAHKTLPLDTYVQVTNLKNGRKVVVKVNDRGPFVSGRIIDLSFAAAKKLGMVGQGVAKVDVKAI